MAINVDSVYKSVLSILNKEQRGYITPDEFNKISKQVQLSLLDQSFTQYNKSVNLQNTHATNEGYADLPQNIQSKIDVFYKTSNITLSSGVGTLPTDLYKIINLSISNQTTKLEKVDKDKIPYLLSSPLTRPSETFPIYYKRVNDIIVEPALSDSAWAGGVIKVEYIKVPSSPRWGYTVDATYGTNIYDNRLFVDTGLVINNTLTLPGTPPTASGTGTTAAIATTVAPAGGSGATIKVTSASANIDTATVVAAGSGYSIGDVIEVQRELMNSDGSIGTTNANLPMTLSADNLYNSSTYGSTNFELHESDESNLILGILGYCGITIKDPTITQQTGQILQANEIVKQQ